MRIDTYTKDTLLPRSGSTVTEFVHKLQHTRRADWSRAISIWLWVLRVVEPTNSKPVCPVPNGGPGELVIDFLPILNLSYDIR
jgi:hypothetical protein